MAALSPSSTSSPSQRLEDAWSVHHGLIQAEALDPKLRMNAQWQLLRMDAYETFYLLMERRIDGR